MKNSAFSKLVYLFIGLFVYWFILPRQVAWAAGEFRADYAVSYTIAPNGTTIVTQNITLTNKLSNLYPKQYAILIDSERLKNIIAYDRGGPIIPTISRKDGKTEILLTFNDKVVGLGKTMSFTLRFENGDVAQQNGSIWEVNIPGVADDSDIGTYTVTVNTPASFGPNAYMTPAPASGNTWTKEQLKNGGISAAYGTKQFFSLILSYHLQNSGVAPVVSQIALPPDTAYQTVTISDITPKPDTVTADADGNWLARYHLGPNASEDITVRATVEVTLAAREQEQPTLNPSDYVAPDQYWETQDPRIVSLTNQYRTPREIYDYVVRTLSYDNGRVRLNPVRKGAVAALATPQQSLCMEFTDLFIAITRAAGIPAREVVGYAYTNNPTLRPLSFVADVLHAWPEYYDSRSNRWIPVDPTWEKTTGGVNYFDKFDFNHVAFVIHGRSSTQPSPAGSYRKEGKQGKDVLVGFNQKPAAALPASLVTEVSFPKTVVAGLPQEGTVIVENTGQTAVSDVTIGVQSLPVDVAITRTTPVIPPYGSVRIPVMLTVPATLAAGSGRINVRVGDATTTSAFAIIPAWRLALPVALAVILGLVLTAVGVRALSIWQTFKKY